MASSASSSSPVISSVKLLTPRPFYLRFDTSFFAILYAIAFTSKDFILIPCILSLHLFLFMFSRSFIHIHALLSHSNAELKNANKVLICAGKNSGKDKITDFKSSTSKGELTIADTSYSIHPYTFEFQKVTYFYDEKNKEVKRIESITSAKISSLLTHSGLTNKEVSIALRIWGLNEFEIPMPGFLDLYFEHLIAPFFVFQVVCLLLWSLDDYWYYSLLTLLMLMMFEGMMCKQRLNSLEMLRNMLRPSFPLFAFRNRTWNTILSDEIVPGDIISLISTRKSSSLKGRRRGNDDDGDGEDGSESIVPCDVLLLRGHCVVNEAMLTGN